MQFELITLLPEIFEALKSGIIGRAVANQLIQYRCWNPRDYASGSYRKVDDQPYGGGAGLVMMVKPLLAAIEAATAAATTPLTLIYLTPQGERLNNQMAIELSQCERIGFVCGRYEGFDERIFALAPGRELSIGDYVLSGGEFAALVAIDAISRQLPGVVGDFASVTEDSFYHGIFDYPQYTRPREIFGHKVPEVLLNGNHREIARWRRKQALARTFSRRPEVFSQIKLTSTDRMLLNEFLEEESS